MKTKIIKTAVIAIALLVANLEPVMAIESLQVRVQGADAILY
jgi:hypothetical protein